MEASNAVLNYEEFRINKDSPANYFELWFYRFEKQCKSNVGVDCNNVKHQNLATEILLSIASVELLVEIVKINGHDTMEYLKLKEILAKEYMCQNHTLNMVKFHKIKQNDDEMDLDYLKRLKQAARIANIEDETTILMHMLLNHHSTTVRSKIMDINSSQKKLQKKTALERFTEWLEGQQAAQDLVRDDPATKAYSNKVVSSASGFNSTKINYTMRETQAYPNYSKDTKTCHFCYGEWPHERGVLCQGKTSRCGYCNKQGHLPACCLDRFLDIIKQTQNKEPFKQQSKQTNHNARGMERAQERGSEKNKPNKQYNTKQASAIKTNTFNALESPQETSDNESTDEELREKIKAKLIKQKEKRMYMVRSVGQTLIKDGTPMKTIRILGIDVVFVLDTGSGLNIFSMKQYKLIPRNIRPKLSKSNELLQPWNTNELQQSNGEFKCMVTLNNKSHMVSFQVVENKHTQVENLLCCKTCVKFELITIHGASELNTIRNQTSKPIKLKEEKVSFEQRMRNEIPRIFENRIGLMDDVEVGFAFDQTLYNPKQQLPYIIPYSLIPGTHKKLKYLHEQDVIEKVKPGDEVTYVSPMRVVSKEKYDEDGDIIVRITSDSRLLNLAIKHVTKIMPNKQQIIYNLTGKKWFAKFDIRDAFFTIKLSKECQKHTTFSTPWGRYRMKRLWMGLSVASEIFNEVFTEKFSNIPATMTAVDDTLTATIDDEQMHEKNVEACLRRLDELNLTINDKCIFKAREIEFWGLSISDKGIKPKESTCKDFLNTVEPKSSKEVHSFVSLASYFHESIPYLAITAKPLRELYKKHATFVWSNEQIEAFRKIKSTLIQECLAHFDPKLEIEIWVDASQLGLGTFLINSNKNVRKIVSCASHCFDKAESNLSMVEKEALALTWAVIKFTTYVQGFKFTVYTDNKAVNDIFSTTRISKKHTTLRIQHWRSLLSQFPGMIVKLIKSEENIADFMSRCLKSNTNIEAQTLVELNAMNIITDGPDKAIRKILIMNQAKFKQAITMESIANETSNDKILTVIKNAVINKFTFLPKERTFDFYREKLEYISIIDDVLVINELIILPHSLIQTVLSVLHEGHMSASSMKKLIHSLYIFKNVNKHVDEYVGYCLACQANVDTTSYEPNISTKLPEGPMEWLDCDYSSMTPGNDYVFLAVCEFSRYPFAVTTRGMTCDHAIGALKKIFAAHRTPKKIKCDNGPCFKAKEFIRFCSSLSIEYKPIQPLWPRANPIAERFMKNINKVIRCSAVDGINWRVNLSNYLINYRATPHSTTGFSPNVVMGLLNEIKVPFLKNTISEKEMYKQLAINDTLKKKEIKHYADIHMHVKPSTLQVGDEVIVKWDANKYKRKHQPLFDHNPYIIAEKKGSMVSAKRPDHFITRNSSYFKKVNLKKSMKSVTRILKQPSIIRPIKIRMFRAFQFSNMAKRIEAAENEYDEKIKSKEKMNKKKSAEQYSKTKIVTAKQIKEEEKLLDQALEEDSEHDTVNESDEEQEHDQEESDVEANHNANDKYIAQSELTRTLLTVDSLKKFKDSKLTIGQYLGGQMKVDPTDDPPPAVKSENQTPVVKAKRTYKKRVKTVSPNNSAENDLNETIVSTTESRLKARLARKDAEALKQESTQSANTRAKSVPPKSVAAKNPKT
jgi:hypothetical protein